MKLFSDPKLFAFAIILAIASFFMFHIMLAQTVSPVVVEIAAAVLGTLLTIVVTGILLNTQTEVELNKESNLKILETKIELYTALMDKIGAVLEKEAVSQQDIINIQLLNQKVAFVASKQVLQQFSVFTEQFANKASDGKLSKSEVNELLEILAIMTSEICVDIATSKEEKGRARKDQQEIVNLIKQNTKNLGKTKTDESRFLDACSTEERDYFNVVRDYLKSNDIQNTMGSKGFSIQNRDGKSVAKCYPTGVKPNNIEIELNRLDENGQAAVLEFLSRNSIKRDPAKKWATFKPAETKPQEFCSLLDQLCAGDGNGSKS